MNPSWSLLLSILRQRKEIRDDISERAVRIYQGLLGHRYGIDSPDISYEDGYYSVNIHVWHSPFPVEEVFPDAEYSWDEDVGYRGYMEYTYDISFPGEPGLILELSYLHQLRLLPYSYIYDTDSITRIEFPLNQQPPLADYNLGSSPMLRDIPEEIKHHILTYAQANEGLILEQIMASDVNYLVEEAKILDPNFSLDNLLDTLRRRAQLASSVNMELLNRLLPVLSVQFDGTIIITNDEELDIQQLLAPYPVEATMEKEGQIYTYTVRSSSYWEIVDNIRIASFLATDGYSLPVDGENPELYEGWFLLSVPLG